MCRFEKPLDDLEKEVKLEYDRSMNRMILEKVVKSDPEFSYITLPTFDPEFVPQNGNIGSPRNVLHTKA